MGIGRGSFLSFKLFTTQGCTASPARVDEGGRWEGCYSTQHPRTLLFLVQLDVKLELELPDPSFLHFILL